MCGASPSILPVAEWIDVAEEDAVLIGGTVDGA